LRKLPMSAVLRTWTISESGGFMKALVDSHGDRILGFTMLGPRPVRSWPPCRRRCWLACRIPACATPSSRTDDGGRPHHAVCQYSAAEVPGEEERPRGFASENCPKRKRRQRRNGTMLNKKSANGTIVDRVRAVGFRRRRRSSISGRLRDSRSRSTPRSVRSASTISTRCWRTRRRWRTCTRSITGKCPDRASTSCTFCSTSTSRSRATWWMRSPSASSHSAVSALRWRMTWRR